MSEFWEDIQCRHQKPVVGILQDWTLIDCSEMPDHHANFFRSSYGEGVLPMFALGLFSQKYQTKFMPMRLRQTSLLTGVFFEESYIVTLNSVYLLAGVGRIEKGELPSFANADKLAMKLSGELEERLNDPPLH